MKVHNSDLFRPCMSEEKTSKIKAPKTDDGFLFWLGIIALVMGVLSVTVIVEKNSVNRK